jgi:hypothetical protein
VPLHFSYSYHSFFFWFEIFHLTSDIASFHYITDTHNDHFSVHKIDNSESTVRLAEGIGASPTPRQPDPARLLGSELAPPPPPHPSIPLFVSHAFFSLVFHVQLPPSSSSSLVSTLGGDKLLDDNDRITFIFFPSQSYKIS